MVPHASSSPKQHQLFGKISEDWHPQQQKHNMKEKRDKLKVFYWAYLKFATSDRVPNISPVLRRHLGRLASQYFPAGRSALLLRGHPKPLSLRRDPVKSEFIRQEPRLSGAAHLKGYSIPLIKGLLKARICPIISENNETEKNRWFRGGKKPCSKAQNCSFAKTGSETIKEVNTWSMT